MTSVGGTAQGPNPARGGRAPNTQVGSASDLGPALDLDEAQIDHAAEVTAVEVAVAMALWRQTAPKWLKDLLD